MSLDTRILDGRGTGLVSHVHAFPGSKTKHNGQLVLQERFLQFSPEMHPFLNPTFGTAMNQAVTFTGVASIIHAGVDSGSATSGTTTSTSGSELIDTSGDFNTTVGIGASVENTTQSTYARVTAVTDNQNLTLDSPIMDNTGDSYVINPIWTGTTVQGSWNFGDSGKITITSANNNDEALLNTDTSRMWDMDNFAALSGKVDLDTYDSNNNTILIEFGLNGVTVGNNVNLNDFIDTGNFAEQSFVIEKSFLGLVSQEVNDLRITITRAGGVKPTIKFDDLTLEPVAGVNPAIFKATTPFGTLFHITEIRISIADALSGIVTGSTTTYPTMPGLSYDKILGVSALTNGIVFSRQQDGVTVFAVNLKQLGDFLGTGSSLASVISDGTNTHIALEIRFPEPIILNGAENSFLSFTINDNLSGLLVFSATAHGAIEI